MSLKVENLEKNMIKLTIEVEASELEKAIDKAYQKQKNHFASQTSRYILRGDNHSRVLRTEGIHSDGV